MTDKKPNVGFIGLGLMGSAMVQHLLDLKYPMTVIANKSRANIDAAVARGAQEVKTAREVAAASDIIMLCMDTSKAVESRMLGDEGVISGLKKGALVIDFGTSLPGSTRMLGEKVKAAGAAYMDAPLGRTPDHGRQGMLNIMAAGDKQDFDRVKPVLEDLGENVFYLGPLGAGHTLKLINNFYAMTTATAMSEAFAIGDRAGVARETLYEVMSAGPLKSGLMDFVKAQAIDKEIKLAFSITNGRKDVGYFLQMAEELGHSSNIGAGTAASLDAAKDDGWGQKMVSEMVDYFASHPNHKSG